MFKILMKRRNPFAPTELVGTNDDLDLACKMAKEAAQNGIAAWVLDENQTDRDGNWQEVFRVEN